MVCPLSYCLGFTFRHRGGLRIRISAKAEKAFRQKTRELTRRTRGRSLARVIRELRHYIQGWKAYYGISEVKRPFAELDKWIRRRLRSYAWKQWGLRGNRRLRELGVSRQLAWNTTKSAHGPWRLSLSPALSWALPTKYFVGKGLPLLKGA